MNSSTECVIRAPLNVPASPRPPWRRTFFLPFVLTVRNSRAILSSESGLTVGGRVAKGNAMTATMKRTIEEYKAAYKEANGKDVEMKVHGVHVRIKGCQSCHWSFLAILTQNLKLMKALNLQAKNLKELENDKELEELFWGWDVSF